MDFPYGSVQPSQKIALNHLAAFTPECLPQLMFNHAASKGTPLHDKFYGGHKADVWDSELGTFFKYELEHPRHCEVDEIPKGTIIYPWFHHQTIINSFRWVVCCLSLFTGAKSIRTKGQCDRFSNRSSVQSN